MCNQPRSARTIVIVIVKEKEIVIVNDKVKRKGRLHRAPQAAALLTNTVYSNLPKNQPIRRKIGAKNFRQPKSRRKFVYT